MIIFTVVVIITIIIITMVIKRLKDTVLDELWN